MRQLNFVRRNTLEWHEVPDAHLQGDFDAIVRPLAVARCDLDVPMLRGDTLIRPAFPFGHEFVGEVIEVGQGVRQFRVGQKVAVAFQISCGSCPSCAGAHSNNCQTVEFTSAYGLGRPSRQWGGAFADRIRVPYADHMMLALPADVDPVDLASLSDNMTDAFRTVGYDLRANPHKRVLIVGGVAKSIGIYAAYMARLLGAPVVDYLDSNRAQLELAARVGANPVEVSEIPAQYGTGYDITVDASGAVEGFRCALRSAGTDAVCTSTSIFFNNDTPIPFLEMYNRTVHLRLGRVASRETMPAVLDLIKTHGFQPGLVTTSYANWEDAPRALFEDTTKLIVRYNS